MKPSDQTEQTLSDARKLTAVEGPHRTLLKRQLMERASRGKEDTGMRVQSRRHVVVYAVCVLLVLVAGGASTTYVLLHWRSGRPEITQPDAVAVAKTVFAALQNHDFSLVEGLFPPKETLASVLPADSPFVARYDELKAKLQAEFEQCIADYPGLTNAVLLRVDGDYGQMPAGPGSSRQVGVFDNAHIFVQIDELVYDIKLDELIEVDGKWYLVELPGKNGASPPFKIETIQAQ